VSSEREEAPAGLVAYVALVRSTVEGGKESKNEATGRDWIEKNGRCASRFLRMGCYRGGSKSFRVSFDLAFEDSEGDRTKQRVRHVREEDRRAKTLGAAYPPPPPPS
jgi:hypothetical protein